MPNNIPFYKKLLHNKNLTLKIIAKLMIADYWSYKTGNVIARSLANTLNGQCSETCTKQKL